MTTTPNTIGITGAAGFIGPHLCDRLVREGRRVIGVDDLSHGSLENLAGVIADENFTFHEFDCRDALRMRQANPTATARTIAAIS